MSYVKLELFAPIFDREDFSYISNLRNIKRISETLLYKIPYPDGNEKKLHIPLVQDYYNNFMSFCGWIDADSVPDIRNGFFVCREELLRGVNLLGMEQSKRIVLQKGGYVKKFNKNFLYGLNRIYNGIKTAFDPKIKTKTNITNEQLIRFFLDKNVGLGRTYLFNTNGEHAFVNKLNGLSRKYLFIVLRLLIDPPVNRTRSVNGWFDVGQAESHIRILIKTTYFGFGKDEVAFLFLTKSDHVEYQKIVSQPAKNFQFVPA